MKKPVFMLAVAMAVAMLRAGIADVDALMEVLWFENAVTEAKTGWSGADLDGLVYADAKYSLEGDEKVSFTPAAQTGEAVRQVFDFDPEPVDVLPEVADAVQTAVVVMDGKYYAWGKATADAESATWNELGAKGTDPLALEIDYKTTPATVRYYQGAAQLGATLFSANAKTSVTQYDFTGAGTITSLTGTQTDTVAAIVGETKYHTLAEALAAVQDPTTVRLVDTSITELPEGYAGYKIENGAIVAVDSKQKEMLYYFPLEGTVENVGGTRGSQDLTVGTSDLCWDEAGWMGSPFGDKSLRGSSAETKVYNADGLVPADSQWAVSFWLLASHEGGSWKDACGLAIGDMIYKLEKTNAKAFQIYGFASGSSTSSSSLANAIVAGDNWVNIIAMCNATFDGIDIYVNGVKHETIAVTDAQLKGFYFSSKGLPDSRNSWLFTDEVSIWNCALDADQIAYLAARPAKKEILDGETDIEPLPIATVEINGEALEGTYNMADALKAIADATDVESAKITLVKPCTDETVAIPAKVTLDANGKSCSATVTGAGTLCGFTAAPTLGEGWTGTVVLGSVAAGTNIGQYGNANSTVKLGQAVTGYFTGACTVAGDLDLAGFTMEFTNGYSGEANAYVFNRLVGSGAVTSEWVGSSSKQYIKINNVLADDDKTIAFTGTLTGVNVILPEGYELSSDGHIVKTVVPEGWDVVTSETDLADVPGLQGYQGCLDVLGVTAVKVKEWAKANSVAYGDPIDVEAFALNCAPADKADEAAKLKLTIAMKADGTPDVSVVTKEPDYNVQPTIKGKEDLADETWSGTLTGKRFFKAFIDLWKIDL